MRFRFRTLRTPLILQFSAIAIIPLVVVLFVVAKQSATMVESAERESLALANADLDHTILGMHAMVAAQQSLLELKLQHNLNVARAELGRAGRITLGPGKERWNATDQFSKKVDQIDLPILALGGGPLAKNTDPSVRTPVIDDVAKLVEGTTTIFQRMNERGDMLRIATNVVTQSNQRAVGTYIPGANPDGSPNRVVATVLEGRTYVGRAFVVNAWYISAYEPITDAGGRIIGMLYVGVREDSVSAVADSILATTVGKTGHAYVLDESGKYVVSANAAEVGKSALDRKDAEGGTPLATVIETAKGLNGKEVGTVSYRAEGGQRLARFVRFAPWQWVIVAEAPESEFLTAGVAAREIGSRSLLVVSLTAVVMGIVAALAGVLLSRRLTAPVVRVARQLEQFAEGRLTIEGGDDERLDELGALSRALRKSSLELRRVIGAVQETAQSVAGGSVELTSSADMLSQAAARASFHVVEHLICLLP